MQKKLLLSVISLFYFGSILAQENKNFQIWKDSTQTDSIRARAYYTYLFNEYMWNKPDSSLILVEDLKEFAKNKDYEYGLGLAYDMTSRSYYYQGDFVKSLQFAEQSLKLFTKLGEKLKISQALSQMGLIYSDQGNDSKALDYIKRSLKIAEEIENKIQMVHTLNIIGNIYLYQEDLQSALKYYQQSLELTNGNETSLDHANSLYYIGLVYFQLSEYNKALENFDKSESIYAELNEQVGISNNLDAKGSVYAAQGDYTQAMSLYKQSLKLDEDFQIYYNVMIKLNNIGNLYLKMKNYNEAIKNCKRSLALGEEYGVLPSQKTSCFCLYEAYKAIGDANRALEYNDRFYKLEDSLNINETSKKLQQMEFAKQVEADSLKQVEKELRTEMVYQTEIRKKDKNKNIAIAVGILFLLLSGGFYSRWRYVKRSKKVIENEKERSENLLLNILPADIAEELKTKGKADARDFEKVSILFTDFKGFTQASEKLSAKDLIGEINHCFQAFDHICTKYNVEKIKTIGDAYMAAGGLPIPSDESVKNTVLAGLEMQAFITQRIEEKKANNEIPFLMRLGIHTGPVVAGIVGVKKFQYDIWGDSVNTASRMESSGEIGEVNISEFTYNLIKDDPDFKFVERGKIEAKGKGEINMYFVSKA